MNEQLGGAQKPLTSTRERHVIIFDSQYLCDTRTSTHARAHTYTQTRTHTQTRTRAQTHLFAWICFNPFKNIRYYINQLLQCCKTLHFAHTVYLCAFLRRTSIILLNRITWLAFVTDIQCVFREVETELLKFGSVSGLKDIIQWWLLNCPSSICCKIRHSEVQLMLQCPLL